MVNVAILASNESPPIIGASCLRRPPQPAGSETLEPRVGVELTILDELDRREALRIQETRELLHRHRSAVNPIGFGIAPHEDVNEASWPVAFLPHFVAERSFFVRSNVGHKLVDGRDYLGQRFGPNLVAGQFVDFTGTALEERHIRAERCGLADAES